MVKSANQGMGIFLFLVHCLLFSFIAIITKKISHDFNVLQILFMQTVGASIILTPFIFVYHIENYKITQYKIHVARAFFWVFASALYFFSMKFISVPKATALSFGVPLFTTILAIIFLKEKLKTPRILSLIVGFIGMLIIIKPGASGFEMASLLVIAAAFMWSMTDIIIKLQGKTHHATINTYYFSIFSAMISLPLAIYFWVTPTIEQMFWFLMLSLIFIFNIITITKAYEYADLTIMMPFAFSQLVFVAALSYLAFGEIMTASTAIGSLVIVVSTSFMSYREKKKHGEFLAPTIAEEIYNIDDIKEITPGK